MLAHCKVVPVQFLDLGQHLLHQLLPEGNQRLRLVGQILKLVHDLRLQEENGALQGHLVGRAFSLSLAQTEKLKVSANVKDIELVLVLPVDQPRT